MGNKKESKKTIEFYANDSEGALEMKKALEDKGYEVNHVYTGVSTPIVIDGSNNMYNGARKIRAMFGLCDSKPTQ